MFTAVYKRREKDIFLIHLRVKGSTCFIIFLNLNMSSFYPTPSGDCTLWSRRGGEVVCWVNKATLPSWESITNADAHCILSHRLCLLLLQCTQLLIREGWLYQNLSKSWHCKDWFDPPSPQSWHSTRHVNATREILTTKVCKSTYFGVKIHFGEIVN